MEDGINLFDDINGKEIKTKKSFKKSLIKGIHSFYKFCFKYRRAISIAVNYLLTILLYLLIKKIF